jgi:RimJ/RimL family protein N-acetyltransferase
LLTPLTVDDADAMVGVLADPALYTFIGGRPPTLEQLRQQYRRQVAGRSAGGSPDWFNWIVRLRDTGEPMGTVQATILDDATRGEIAWIIGVPWQGNGFAREAVAALARWLHARRVAVLAAHVHPDHGASAVVARAAGLAPTGDMHDGEQRWASHPPGLADISFGRRPRSA